MVIVTSAPITLNVFMRPHLFEMSNHFEVTAICNGNYFEIKNNLPNSINFFPIKIIRKVSLFFDILALVRLTYFFTCYRPLIIHSVTPKAGLLSMIGGWIARVPVRIHIFTGQVWVTKKGLSRAIFRAADKLTSFFATHVLTDSKSQREFLINEEVCKSKKILVLAAGSISGVDLQRFKVDNSARISLRKELSIDESDKVILFVGRLNREKGIIDLALAFSALCQNYKKIHLIIVGPDEGMIHDIEQVAIGCLNRIHIIGMSNCPERYMAASDILALPSYREGFGSVIIEAAACGIPSVASRIYGLTDAIEDCKSGYLHEAGNVSDLTSKLMKLIENDKLRIEMGEYARARVVEYFSVERVVKCQIEFYFKVMSDLFKNKNLRM